LKKEGGMEKNRFVKEIYGLLEILTGSARQSGFSWDFRIFLAHRIFRIFSAPRFVLQPVDLEQVVNQLKDCVDLTEKILIAKKKNKEADIADKRDPEISMQYLYGLAWAQQSDREYYHGASHFADRLLNSNLDISFLKGAKCLDLGTGHARYALAMVHLGAISVVGIDFSNYCLDEARRRLNFYPKEAGKIKLLLKDVYKLPKNMNGAFDFVCANGFIHHLPDPVRGWQAMFDCLKKGGHAFTFVFADGGTPWWRAIDLMRELLRPVPLWFSHKTLEGYEVSGNQIFNILDYSYTPIQHRFERGYVEDTLHNIGFREIHFLTGGVIHDSVLRSRLFETDRQLYGNSEIRYLFRK